MALEGTRLAYVAGSTSIQISGMGRAEKERIDRAIREALAKTPGKWRVQFLGAMSDDMWEICVSGPGVETSHFLDKELGQHEPEFIASAVVRIAES